MLLTSRSDECCEHHMVDQRGQSQSCWNFGSATTWEVQCSRCSNTMGNKLLRHGSIDVLGLNFGRQSIMVTRRPVGFLRGCPGIRCPEIALQRDLACCSAVSTHRTTSHLLRHLTDCLRISVDEIVLK